jgi:DNA-binding response OmpR family regulator
MVECATTGELGLAHALNDRPGLIVVDEGISLEGGVPLAGLLNHHRELSGIPVIVLSRRDSGSSASLAQGQPSRLTLPFRPSQLLALVREAL